MNKLFNLILRYLLILIFGLGNFYILYLILTPLTLYLTFSLLTISSSAVLSNGLIYIGSSIIEIIPACVAGAAYYLLLLLILSTPNLTVRKYLKLIGFSFGVFLLFNILRLVFLVSIRNASQFDLIHRIFWYILSTLVVVLIWFFLVKKYKIKGYPIISDISYLLSQMKSSKKIKKPK